MSHRRWPGLRAAVLALAVSLLVLSSGCSSGKTDHATTGHTTTGVLGLRASPSNTPAAGQGPTTDGLQALPSAPYLIAAALEENRLFAIDWGLLLDAATNGHPLPTVLGYSDLVGAASEVYQTATGDVVVAATNRAELTRLSPRLKKIATLAIARAVDSGQSPLRYGPLIGAGNDLFVAVGFADNLAIVRIDVAAWTIAKAVVFHDRFVGYPRMCRLDNGHLAVTSTGRLDFLEPQALERVATADLSDGTPSGVACVGDAAWVSNIATATGTIVGGDGGVAGRFHWRGTSSSRLLYDRASGSVFGSDAPAGTVFRCRVSTRACETSASLGQKPTDLLTHAGRLLVSLEGTKAIAVVDADTLASVGRVSLPASPRTLTLIT